MELRKKMPPKNTMIAIICCVVAACCFVYVLADYMRKAREEQIYEEMRNTVATEASEETEAVVLPEATETGTIFCDSVYDFEELCEQNPDIYAWISVPGTQVDYPVFQSETDNYYLDHNMDGSAGYPGTVYTNKCNAKDFSNYNTVLYGHNMGNGTMFGSLHSFEDETFFDANDSIVVYTKDKRLTYQIYAAVKFSDEYIPAYYNVNTAEGMMTFLEALETCMDEPESHQRSGVMVTEEDHIITLSTCVKNERSRRYLIIGKLIEEACYN